MSEFEYFMKTERPQVGMHRCSEGYCQSTASAWRKPEERRWLKLARMATADHDRQGQAAHRQ